MMDGMDTVSPRAWNPYGIHMESMEYGSPCFTQNAATKKAPTTGFHPGSISLAFAFFEARLLMPL
jgi:hypothetical protein